MVEAGHQAKHKQSKSSSAKARAVTNCRHPLLSKSNPPLVDSQGRAEPQKSSLSLGGINWTLAALRHNGWR